MSQRERAKAGADFASACDLARSRGFSLIAHGGGNSSFELRRGTQSLGWYFPDRGGIGLLNWVRAATNREAA